MEERLIASQITIPAHDEAAVVAQPGESAFHFPAATVTPQFTSILGLGFDAVAPVRADQLDAAAFEPFTQRVGIRPAIVNQPPGLGFRAASSLPRHAHLRQRRFDECHFPRRRRVEVGCQRNSLAACHHHPFCTLSALGLSDAAPPFFAGAKLPSAKHSSQSNRWAASSSASRIRQTFNHTPWSSHSSSRRRHVEYEGYSLGKSFHRAPDRSTHKIPSKQGRFGTALRPPFDDVVDTGSNGAIFAHCSSLISGFFIGDSFRRIVNHNLCQGANL